MGPLLSAEELLAGANKPYPSRLKSRLWLSGWPGQPKRAGRFSRNAVMPSRASGVWLEAAMSSIA